MTRKAYLQSKFGKPQRKRSGFYYSCEVCHKEFYVPKCRVAYTENKGQRIRYCSVKCAAIGRRGEGNPMWGKKLSPEAIAQMMANPNRRSFSNPTDNPNYRRFGKKPHDRSTLRRWKHHIMKTRGNVCERCGYKTYPVVLELHHVDGNKKHLAEDNLKLLCPTCHEETHYLEGTGKYKKYALTQPRIKKYTRPAEIQE